MLVNTPHYPNYQSPDVVPGTMDRINLEHVNHACSDSLVEELCNILGVIPQEQQANKAADSFFQSSGTSGVCSDDCGFKHTPESSNVVLNARSQQHPTSPAASKTTRKTRNSQAPRFINTNSSTIVIQKPKGAKRTFLPVENPSHKLVLTCNECTFATIHSGNHKRHLETHRTNRTREPCSYCIKTFSTPFNLERHRSSAHRNIRKPDYF